MELRGWRVLAYRGDTASLGARMAARIRQTDRPAPCEGAVMTCRRLMYEAMRDPSAPGSDEGLEVYLAVPGRESGRLAVDLAEVAARVCERNLAHAFGANLLAATTAQVAPSRLGPHLARTLELYVAGKDEARAGVIAAYAKARLRDGSLAKAPWPNLLKAAEALGAPEKAEKTAIHKPLKKAIEPSDLVGPKRASTDLELNEARLLIEKAKALADAATPPAPASTQPSNAQLGSTQPGNTAGSTTSVAPPPGKPGPER